MEYVTIFLLAVSLTTNGLLFYNLKKRKPKLDPRTMNVIEALKHLDREGQVMIHLEAIHPDDVFLRSRGRA